MSNDGIEDLIAELARVHKVVIGVDDPVAMQLTANRFLLRESAAQQEKTVQEFREVILTASSDWNKLANKRAEVILNAAVSAAKHAVAAGAEDGLAAGLTPFLDRADAIARRTENQLRQTRRLLWTTAGILAVAAVSVAAVGLLLALHH